jgi:hypothetical protein
MKVFTAIYTPWDHDKSRPDQGNARTVLVVEILPGNDGHGPVAVFIDDDNSLKSDRLAQFKHCHSTEWLLARH